MLRLRIVCDTCLGLFKLVYRVGRCFQILNFVYGDDDCCQCTVCSLKFSSGLRFGVHNILECRIQDLSIQVIGNSSDLIAVCVINSEPELASFKLTAFQYLLTFRLIFTIRTIRIREVERICIRQSDYDFLIAALFHLGCRRKGLAVIRIQRICNTSLRLVAVLHYGERIRSSEFSRISYSYSYYCGVVLTINCYALGSSCIQDKFDHRILDLSAGFICDVSDHLGSIIQIECEIAILECFSVQDLLARRRRLSFRFHRSVGKV